MSPEKPPLIKGGGNEEPLGNNTEKSPWLKESEGMESHKPKVESISRRELLAVSKAADRSRKISTERRCLFS